MATSVTNKDNYNGRKSGTWKQKELFFLVTYALVFYAIIIRRSLQISHGIFLFSYITSAGFFLIVFSY
jgi:hypothetical protein